MRKPGSERSMLGEHTAIHPMLGAGIIEEQEEIDEFPNGLTAHGASVASQIVPGLTDIPFTDSDSDDDGDERRRRAMLRAHSPPPQSYLTVPAQENVYFPDWDSLPEKFLISDAGTFLAYFKAFVGAGVLFLPHAFMSGGLTASVLTFIATTILSTLCMLKMVEAKQRVVEDFRAGITHGVQKIHETVGFGMLGDVVWGPVGRFIVDVSIAISQLCFATAYLIFISKNLHNIIWQWGDCADEYKIPSIYIIWMTVPLLIPTMFIRHLAKFAVSILIADLLIVAGLLFLYYRSALTMVDQGGVGPGIIQVDPIGYWTFLGTALYALEGTAFVLPIEHAMKNKKNFAKVTIVSGLSIGFMYMTFGLVGYLAFGSSVEAVITLNLKHRNPHDPTAVAVQLAYCIALVLAFPVALFPVVRVVEAKLFSSDLAASNAPAAHLSTQYGSATISSGIGGGGIGGGSGEYTASSSGATTPFVHRSRTGSPIVSRGGMGGGSLAAGGGAIGANGASSSSSSLSSSSCWPQCSSKTWAKNGVRALLTVVCACVASGGGSSFDNFVSLVGGLMCVPLTLIYPAYFHLRVCGDRATLRQRAEDWACVVVGALGAGACTGVSIWQWYQGASSDVDTCNKI